MGNVWSTNKETSNAKGVKYQASSLTHVEESKLPNRKNIVEGITHTAPTLLASSSRESNSISVVRLDNKQNYANFEGVQISQGGLTHVKEIPNTKLLVSLNHNYLKSANMAIFDLSWQVPKKIYSFEGVSGVVGTGDVAFNARRNILGSMPLRGRIAYHLHSIEYSAQKGSYNIQLLRKSKWHAQHSPEELLLQNIYISSFDFDPSGETGATIDNLGMGLVSNVNTDRSNYKVDFGENDQSGRCRWSTNSSESLLFVKYGGNKLNILDTEKKILTLKQSLSLETLLNTYWIDVCQRDGNMLVSGGEERRLKIFDKRCSKVVRTFTGIHSDNIVCVRWSPSGDMIATASFGTIIALLDFKTGKLLYTGDTSDRSIL